MDQHGCAFLREGGNHTLFTNRTAKKVLTVPRHNEINQDLARKTGPPSTPASRQLKWRSGRRRHREPRSTGSAGADRAAGSMSIVDRLPQAAVGIRSGLLYVAPNIPSPKWLA